MAARKFIPDNWRVFVGDKTSIVNNPGFFFSVETDHDPSGEGKRKKYYTVYLATKTNVYEFWFRRNEEIGDDERYHSNGDAPEMNSDFKKVISDDELESIVKQFLNNNRREESIIWSSVDIDYDGFIDLDSERHYPKWHPFDAVINTRRHTNDNGNSCEEIGVILRFDECEVRAIIHSELLFTHTDFERDLYKEAIEECPKDWWFFNSYFITLTNKRTGKINRLCYVDEKPKCFVEKKLSSVIAKLNEGL